MNELVKTSIFVALAAVALVSAWLVQPSVPAGDSADDLGGPFFPDFTDPLAATGLEIVSFDEDTGEVRRFQVARQNGAWVIPSHHNYAADAQRQMADAASAVIGLSKLSIESDDRATHNTFGVIDPQNASTGDTGVGTLVRLSDKDKNILLELIVGKQVEDAPGVRYARVPGQDRVYTTQISIDNLSTDFVDWVERDFLDLDAFNIRQVMLDDHRIDEAQGVIIPGEILTLSYDPNADEPWSLAGGLAEGLELDESKLDAMRSALDDLEIINVEPKPAVLAENLRQGREIIAGLTEQQATQIAVSLVDKGFVPARDPDSPPSAPQYRVYSNQGQIFVGMADGVEYILRFGEIADEPASAAPAGEAPGGGVAAESQANSRYIYVVAQVNTELLTKPQLEPAPEVPTLEEIRQRLQEEDKNDDAPPTAPGDEAAEDNSTPRGVPEAAEAEGGENEPASEGEAADETGGQNDQNDAESDLDARAQAELESLQQQAQQVENSNAQLQADYEDRIARARERVAQLNRRFADWYYVISDAVYREIKLTRGDIVQKKEPTEAEKNLAAARAFLEANKQLPGVQVTESGLQYQVIEPGAGDSPAADSAVRVNYTGKLISGEVFDQGENAEFAVNGVIAGWTEGLQLMKPGAKYRFYIPSDLAYGEAGSPPDIGPHSALIFEVELLEVQ